MNKHDQTLMRVTMALMQVSRAYKSAADKLASEFDLSQATAWPAAMIGRLGESGVRPGTVADMLGLEPSSVVRVIDQLIDGGLVERHEDPLDRRAKLLRLTAEGKNRVAKIEDALVPFRRKMLKGVSQADLDACLRVFEALNTSVKRFDETSKS
ncbi:MAG: MarR family transcriptional regulator [Burkholderiaceae bacterium]|nr:MarR family transcriptional regulator [Burkholderiaceae bacterium]